MTAYALVDDDGGIDRSERLSPDDMATQREAEFLTAALRHQAKVAAATQHQRGACAHCGALCLPQAVYCDNECRAEDEARRRVLQRTGRLR